MPTYPNQTNKTLGQVAYESFYGSVGGRIKLFSIPVWNGLDGHQKAIWEKVAADVKAAR